MVKFKVTKVPSLNSYVRHGGGKHYKSKEVTIFEQELILQFKTAENLPEPKRGLEILFAIKRQRDLDNLPKVFIDVLSWYYNINDSMFDRLVLLRRIDNKLQKEIIVWDFFDLGVKNEKLI